MASNGRNVDRGAFSFMRELIAEDESNGSDSDLSIENDSGEDYVSDDDSTMEVDLQNLDPNTVTRDGDWSDDLRGLGEHVAPFTSPVGPTNPLQDDASPIDYFFLLFKETFIVKMVQETNRYAQQTPQKNRNWEDTTVEEMKAYLAIFFYMGLVKIDCITDYWSNDETNQPYVSNMIPRNRFQEISKNLHLADNSINPPRGQPNHDPLARVRPILDMVQETWPANYNPQRNLCVDEAMIKFKGRCPFLQYLPAKPTKWGIKAWAICDSQSYYMLNLNIYIGRYNNLQNDDLPLGDRVVIKLSEPYYNKNHVIFFDNYFTSLTLLNTLSQNGTYGCGTLRTNRRGFPAFVKDKKCVKKSGDTVRMRKNNMQAIAWFDRRKVTVASTAHDASDITLTRRARRDVPPVQYSQPTAIREYNLNYFGVDKNDQLRQYYSVASRAHKYWKYIMWFLIDVCSVNAFILYMLHPLPSTVKRLTHKQFQLGISRSLANNYCGRKKVGRPLKRPSQHELSRICTKRGQRDCVQCKLDGKKTANDRAKQTRLECVPCGKALCKDCFSVTHPDISD